jgi:hypothetical protein
LVSAGADSFRPTATIGCTEVSATSPRTKGRRATLIERSPNET